MLDVISSILRSLCAFKIQMHPRALHILVFVLCAVIRAGCDDKVKWYSGIQSMLKNCPSEYRNSSGPDEFLEIFRRCVQQKIVESLDALFDEDIITIFDGIDLIRFRPDPNVDNSTKYK